MAKFTVEAVTVCINYADFLSVVAPFNRHLFDRWVIVTTPKDLDTRDVCRRYNLHCIVTEEVESDGDSFSKGWLVERGLQHLRADGWRLHLDADIVLPSNTHHLLEAAVLDPAYIYGCDRVMVKGWDQWTKLRDTGFLHTQLDYNCRVRWPAGLPIGTRWAHHESGYVPIGFFQLWHSTEDLWRGTRTKPYPTNHNTACRTDVQHALQWDRSKRALLPELIAVHLESEDAPEGHNWRGRKTKPFGPPLPKPNCQPPS